MTDYQKNFCLTVDIVKCSTGPSAPTKFSGNVFGRYASVSWNEPVNKNGIVRKYIIEVYMTKTGEVARSLQINATKKREAMITELTPFTNYTFTIRAFTIKAGEWANFTARTKEEGNRRMHLVR